jgi:hypothetical protein
MPADLKRALASNHQALTAWEDITPLARNEWICWIESAKKAETRSRRIEWRYSRLKDGKRRPCFGLDAPTAKSKTVKLNNRDHGLEHYLASDSSLWRIVEAYDAARERTHRKDQTKNLTLLSGLDLFRRPAS